MKGVFSVGHSGNRRLNHRLHDGSGLFRSENAAIAVSAHAACIWTLVVIVYGLVIL